MPRGKVELTPEKRLCKIAELLGLNVLDTTVLLQTGKENIGSEENVAEFGNRLVSAVEKCEVLNAVTL